MDDLLSTSFFNTILDRDKLETPLLMEGFPILILGGEKASFFSVLDAMVFSLFSFLGIYLRSVPLTNPFVKLVLLGQYF